MLDRRMLDGGKFRHNGKTIPISEIAKQNNLDIESFKDQLIKMILDGTIVYLGSDKSNYPILEMKLY